MRVGCAGWGITAPHRAAFGDGASVLARYATVFDCVEINSSFYRSHQASTYTRWADSVPKDFRFAVKLPRTITHDARLQGAGKLLDTFLAESNHLGDKLGALLVQLPPSLEFDARHASTFFALLRRRHAGPVTLEPRHASWFAPRAEALLQKHGVARVAADPAPIASSELPGGASTLRYWRWHGAPRMYYSRYDDAALLALAEQIRAHAKPANTSWCIFDNTAHGHAIPNALRLRELLAAPPRTRTHA